MPPNVSVIMPVYNGEKYLQEALQSIRDQSLSDFEFIIVNDASTDSSRFIIERFAQLDARVRLYNNKNNLGLPATLNCCLEIAQGRYIARMDQDDISLPNRLDEQVKFMDAHPDVGICGVWVELIGARQGERWQHPIDHDSIYARMLFNDALAHPTVMMRASSMREHNLLYNEKSLYIEDYELWSRALRELKFANLGQVLLKYRIHTQGMSVKYRAEQIQAHDTVYRRLLESFRVKPSSRELLLHQKIANFQYETNLSFLSDTYTWLKKISYANRGAQIIPSSILDAELNMWWHRVCSHVFFHPSASPRLIFGMFRFPMGKINKISYRLACLMKPGVNSK